MDGFECLADYPQSCPFGLACGSGSETGRSRRQGAVLTKGTTNSERRHAFAKQALSWRPSSELFYGLITPSPVSTSSVQSFGSGSLNLPSPISNGIQR